MTMFNINKANYYADINEIQMLMAKYIMNIHKMDFKSSYDDLMANNHPEISFEYMESGEYKGPEKVKAYMYALDDTFRTPRDKKGYMGLQHINTPKIIINDEGNRARGNWTILSPWAMQAYPYPGDERKLTAMWFIGRYSCEFIKIDQKWKILKVHLVSYVRTPYDQGWVRQPDAMPIKPMPALRPDNPPRYYTYHPGCAYTHDNIFNWGPYLPKETDF